MNKYGKIIKLPLFEEYSDDEFKIHSPLIYHRYKEYDTEEIIVPAGFITDGASIPQFMWNLGSPFTGTYRNAAFIHDYLYASEWYSRTECDQIFLEVMYESGTSWIRRNAMWSAVRAFGRKVWDDHKIHEVMNNRALLTSKDDWGPIYATK